MIAFLASSIASGRQYVGSHWGWKCDSNNFIHLGEQGQLGEAFGFIASNKNHLRGKLCSGYVVLDPVSVELKDYASLRVVRSLADRHRVAK